MKFFIYTMLFFAPFFAIRGQELINETHKIIPEGLVLGRGSLGVLRNQVAVSGDIAILGSAYDGIAPVDNSSPVFQGRVSVFDVTTGEQLRVLTAPGPPRSSLFGASVDLSGNIAVIGAAGRRVGDTFNNGSAYLFDVTTGELLHELIPDNTLDSPTGLASATAFFGVSVAISGNIAIVGDTEDDEGGPLSGSVSVFDVTTGQLLRKLLPVNDTARNGDFFGSSVDLSGNIAVIGVPLDDTNGGNSGSSYLFDVTTGEELHWLIPDLEEGVSGVMNQVGTSVAISGNTTIIMGPGASFVFDTGTGEQLDDFPIGSSIAIQGNTAVVGFEGADDNGLSSGNALLIDIPTQQVIQTLLPSDGEFADLFGSSVAISGNTVIVEASGDDGVGSIFLLNSGSAYLFDVSLPLDIGEVVEATNTDVHIITFPTMEGVSYTLERAVDLDGEWTATDETVTGDGNEQSFCIDITLPREFYRVEPSG